MKATISVRPTFDIILSAKMVDLLINLAINHYDHTCKAMPSQGGLLFRWGNQVKFGAACTATFRELDTTLKLCEDIYTHTKFTDNENDLITGYFNFVADTLRQSDQFIENIEDLIVKE